MTRCVDLKDYIPLIVANFKEINVILAGENKEFTHVWEALERVLKNKFIVTADENQLSKYEKMLKIFPSINDTIESRRARIQAMWFIELPYTWRMLLQKVTEICGTATIILEDSYLINLKVEVKLQWQIDSFIDIVSKMLPCNMGMRIKNVLPLDLEIPTPTVRPEWFDYKLEYQGDIYEESKVSFKTLFIFMQLSFWNDYLYNGRKKYNAVLQYNAKRNYILHVKIKSLFELYMNSGIGYEQIVKIFILNCPEVNVVNICQQFGIAGDKSLRSKLYTYLRLKGSYGDIDMQIITQRNAVRYDGTRRYNGAMKYNALYRRETVE
ncbi:MAG: YmfQ family protein [Lachnospiraceae bacterium]